MKCKNEGHRDYASFNCDEKFTPGHRCRGPQILLLDGCNDNLKDDEIEDSLKPTPGLPKDPSLLRKA